MSFVELNRQAQVKPFIKLIELEVNKKYKIIDMERTITQFGSKIIVFFEDCRASLPDRYNRLITDEVLQKLRNTLLEKDVYLTSLGPVGSTVHLQFIEN